VALFNPKTALFFAAFLPQFMVPSASNALQLILLAMVFVTIAAVTDAVYALSASIVAALLPRLNAGRFLAAGTYFGIGLLTAFSSGRGNQ
jgi:threonine/homoserine/homoserine lactone efflux protein